MLRDRGMFAYFAFHLFSADGRHSSAIVDLLRLIKRPEDLHIEVRGIISYPHLATALLYDVSQRWRL